MPLIYKIDVLKALDEAGWPQIALRHEGILGEATISNLRHKKMIGTVSLARICALLHCQPGDLLEYVDKLPPEKKEKTARERVKEWKAKFPDSRQRDCADMLGLSCAIVNRYWNEPDVPEKKE